MCRQLTEIEKSNRQFTEADRILAEFEEQQRELQERKKQRMIDDIVGLISRLSLSVEERDILTKALKIIKREL